ncbi:MAG: hypothetical protein ABFC56_02945, partial [Clostridiaceae bacterium]
MIYAELRFSLGYTTAQIDALFWQDYIDLLRYWRKHPTCHTLMAMQMDYKPPAENITKAEREKNMSAFLTMVGR